MGILQVLSIDPVNNSTIYINQQFNIVFDKKLNTTNVNNNIMLINSGSNAQIPLTITYKEIVVDGNTVGKLKIVPNEQLEMNRLFYLVLRGDFNVNDTVYTGIISIDNDVFNGNKIFTFTTNTLTYNPPIEDGETPPPPSSPISYITSISFRPQVYPSNIFVSVDPSIFVMIEDEITKVNEEKIYVSISDVLNETDMVSNLIKNRTITQYDKYIVITLNDYVEDKALPNNKKISIYLDEDAIESDAGVTPAILYYFYSPMDVIFASYSAVKDKLTSLGYGDNISNDIVMSVLYKESSFIRSKYRDVSVFPTKFFYLSEQYILKRLDREYYSGVAYKSAGIRQQTMLGVNIVFNTPSENNAMLKQIDNELYALETEMRATLMKYGTYAIKSELDIGYPVEWRTDV